MKIPGQHARRKSCGKPGSSHGRWRALLTTLLAFVAHSADSFAALDKQSANIPAPLVDFLAPQKAPADAALTPEGERKAEAMASFIMGLLHEQEGDQKKMIEALQRAVDLETGNSILAERLAYEYLRMNDVPAAIGVLKDAIAANPSEHRLLLQLASLYSQSLGRHDTAFDYASKARKLAPTDPDVFETILMINLSAGDRNAGRRTIRETLSLKHKEPEFWIGCAQVSARLLIPDLEPRKASKEDVLLVNQLFQRALDEADDNLDILLAVADFRQRSGFAEEAAKLLERILESEEAELPLRVAAHDRLARALLSTGDRKGAIAQLEQLVTEAPLQRDAYDFLGQLYEEDEQPERALANYEQVLLLRPTQPLPFLRTAELYVQTGQPDRAVQVLQDARRAFPQLPQLTYSLAIAYSHAKRHELALRTFDLAIQESRATGEEITTPSFYFNYGIAAEKAGRLDLAIRYLELSAEMDIEKAAPVLNYLGYMLVLEGEHLDKAESAIKKALELDPDNGAYLDSLGWLEYQRGNYQKALHYLLKAEKKINPQDPANYEIYDHIGDAYHQLGQLDKALTFWRRAASMVSTPESIQQKINAALQDQGSATPASPQEDSTQPSPTPTTPANP